MSQHVTKYNIAIGAMIQLLYKQQPQGEMQHDRVETSLKRDDVPNVVVVGRSE